ncbi:hypothetical protein B2J93_9379 [Marssonina coronariae]|uniref:Uncharacterized protein n=1 Tax=Diplocarpon coronariae TaxID=2795749 RepID=A0A218Z8A3_9HELO|nr:hypothetical protein B2J93_9379 [Marssonina coronariae]
MNPLAIPGTILLLLTHFFSATAKRGLAFNNPSTHIRSFGGAGNQVNWAYKCDSARDDGTLGGVMYVPMLWSAGAEYTKNIQFVLIHWYYLATNLAYFKKYVQDVWPL